MTFYYKQHTDSVTTYKRCYRIDGANPYVGNPSLTFREETVTTASDGTVLVKLPCGDPLVAEMTTYPSRVRTVLTVSMMSGSSSITSTIFVSAMTFSFAAGVSRPRPHGTQMIICQEPNVYY